MPRSTPRSKVLASSAGKVLAAKSRSPHALPMPSHCQARSETPSEENNTPRPCPWLLSASCRRSPLAATHALRANARVWGEVGRSDIYVCTRVCVCVWFVCRRYRSVFSTVEYSKLSKFWTKTKKKTWGMCYVRVDRALQYMCFVWIWLMAFILI